MNLWATIELIEDIFSGLFNEFTGVFVTSVYLIPSVTAAFISTIFYFSILRNFKQNYITKMYEWKRNREKRTVDFTIYEEPNLNRHNDTVFSTKGSFIALFKDQGNNLRFTYYMRHDVARLRADIEGLHITLLANIRMCDILQVEAENNSSDLITQQYERYNHEVKRDLSNIRRLESVYKCYNKTYICKPEYSGEERDNVNTY